MKNHPTLLGAVLVAPRIFFIFQAAARPERIAPRAVDSGSSTGVVRLRPALNQLLSERRGFSTNLSVCRSFLSARHLVRAPWSEGPICSLSGIPLRASIEDGRLFFIPPRACQPGLS